MVFDFQFKRKKLANNFFGRFVSLRFLILTFSIVHCSVSNAAGEDEVCPVRVRFSSEKLFALLSNKGYMPTIVESSESDPSVDQKFFERTLKNGEYGLVVFYANSIKPQTYTRYGLALLTREREKFKIVSLSFGAADDWIGNNRHANALGRALANFPDCKILKSLEREQ